MKEYNLIGRDIGIVVQADSLEEAIQKAEDILLQGYGGYIESLDEYEDFDDSPAWEDDSDRGCKDCPDDECTGHCMSCYYRPV